MQVPEKCEEDMKKSAHNPKRDQPRLPVIAKANVGHQQSPNFIKDVGEVAVLPESKAANSFGRKRCTSGCALNAAGLCDAAIARD